MATKSTPAQTFHVPGLSADESTTVVAALQDRLFAYTDLHLVLKHVHWNVVGPNFIGVHEMLDPQVELVRGGGMRMVHPDIPDALLGRLGLILRAACQPREERIEERRDACGAPRARAA